MTLTITSPLAGDTVSGVVTVKVTAPGIQKVNFYIDGVLKGRDQAAPFTFDWYTTRYAEGFHEVKAVSSNGRQSARVNVTVKNTITPPPPDPSPDNTLVPPAPSIVDSNRDVWTITGGQIAKNGTVDSHTANVTLLAWEKGVVWQQNNQNLWWEWTGTTWEPDGGTATSPVPQPPGQWSVAITGSTMVGDTLTAVITQS